jgi:hypothetical protein
MAVKFGAGQRSTGSATYPLILGAESHRSSAALASALILKSATRVHGPESRDVPLDTVKD